MFGEGREKEKEEIDFCRVIYYFISVGKELLHFCSFKNAGFRFIRLRKKKR